MAFRGKYQRLYTYLCGLRVQEWRTTFGDIESIIGLKLPKSARRYRQWWGNQSDVNGRSQARAWSIAGWETTDVDMDAETLLFRRKHPEAVHKFNLDEAWPVHRAGAWPEGLSLRREDFYENGI